MGLEMFIEDFLVQLLTALIVAAIIGAATSFYVLIKCVHKQARDIALMKRANIIVIGMIVKDAKRLHGSENITDVEQVYKELVNSD